MKFNKRSLVKVAILSAILGLNGMCFDNVVNGAEVAVEEAVVRNGKCAECGTDNPMFNFTTGESLCNLCMSRHRRDMRRDEDGTIVWVLDDKFIKDYKLTEEDRKIMNESFKKQAARLKAARLGVPGFRIAEDGFARVRVENKNPEGEVCPICYDRKPIKLLCCGNFMCENCILKQNAKRRWGDGLINTNCPFCRCSGTSEIEDPTTGAKFTRQTAWDDMVKLAKVLNKRAAEKEKYERTLADDLKRFNGDHVSFAREQGKYADANLAELTNERANQLLDEGRIEEVHKMFYEADSYREDKEILKEDVRAAIGQTSSNCSQNACCESERVTTTSDFAPGYGPVTVTLSDGTTVTVD